MHQACAPQQFILAAETAPPIWNATTVNGSNACFFLFPGSSLLSPASCKPSEGRRYQLPPNSSIRSKERIRNPVCARGPHPFYGTTRQA